MAIQIFQNEHQPPPTPIPHITSRKLDKKENKNLDASLRKRLDKPKAIESPTIPLQSSHICGYSFP